jgi:hypothetical protein
LSRDGALLAFESRATDPKSGATATSIFLGTFVYTISSDTFVEIGNRPTSFTDIGRFPDVHGLQRCARAFESLVCFGAELQA